MRDVAVRTPQIEIAKKIRASSTIAIVLPELLTLEIAGSAAAFARALAAMQKTVTVFGPPLIPERIRAAFGASDGASEPLREFIISFDLARSPIKELRYERAENRLNIILSPIGPRIARDDIEFRYGALRYDCAIALGVPAPEAAAASIARAPELLHEKFVINIDADPTNAGYGDQNLIADEQSRETLAELVHALLAECKAPLDDPAIAGPLLAALASATNEFRLDAASASAFRIAGELASIAGALPEAAGALAANREDLPAIQLASRAVARSRLDENGETLWSLLTREDFLRTGAPASSLPAALARLHDEFRAFRRIVFLAEDLESGAVTARLFFRDPAAAHALDDAGATPENGWMRLAETFPSIATAEEHITALLQGNAGVQ